MPYGISWPKFIAFAVSAIMSTAAGSQVVHHYYKPLQDLDDMVKDELKRLKAANGVFEDNPIS